MNCSDFESIVNDLARQQMLDAAERARGLAHAEGCARCCARLDVERALTQGLRTLAASDAEAQAPARVEAALLSAFHQRDKIVLLKPAARTVRLAQRRRWATAGLAAAVALLFVAVAASRMQRATQTRAVVARDAQPLTLTPTLSNPTESVTPAEPDVALTERGLRPQLASLQMSNRTRDRLSAGGRRAASIVSPQPASATASANEGDIATEFIPLTYGADLSSLDSGRVVRVELPRTALARYGLPMNAERAGEPVTADVLLGEDGLAQAIRFVR